jgi:hypothetical protein
MPPLITNPNYFLESMRRIHTEDSEVLFHNSEKTLRLMLRKDSNYDSEDDDMDNLKPTTKIEFLIQYREDEDPHGRLYKLLDWDAEGYFCDWDSTAYILDDFDLPSGPSHSIEQNVAYALERINKVYNYSICGCGERLIKDERPICFFCHMTGSNETMEEELCCICHEKTPRVSLKVQTCCKQYIHPRCLSTWEHTKETGAASCPLCRQNSVK